MRPRKPRKLTDAREIEEVFSYAYSCKCISTNMLTGAIVEGPTGIDSARRCFETRRPHSGMWEVEPMRFVFAWQDSERQPNRGLHRIEFLCAAIPE